MKLSENWLREWVNPAISTDEVVKQLTMAGLEVDGVESVALEFQKVVVGKVLQVEPHPDADKLRICQVNVGQDAPLKIVCGAANVHAGMIAPTAIVGANLGDFKIKKAKLRGVESFGMLCSAKELGLAESSDGLMPLAGDAPIGEDIRDYLNLDDVTIDIDLTPNRGDCLSIAGIAREMGLLTRTLVEPIETKAIDATISDTFPVEIDDTRVCPRYIGRVIKNINPNATTPLWMQEKLRRCGLRSISPVVDITNYVLLELGQPMHAFDLDKLKGGIKVRMAQKGEKLTLLDEKEVKLDDKTLIIADHEKPLAMAGVMGGLNSAVTDATQTIFLESAFFTPEQLAGCARRYGLSTDSSHRFERGVDPYLQRKATERATALLLDIVGGEAGEIIEVADEATLPIKNTITLRKARVTRVLGKTLDDNDITEILTRLEMQVTQTETGWAVIPPSFRFDIAIEADLIEELARVHGYNNFPSTVPQGHLDMREQHDNDLMRLQAVLVQRDYQETITYSFVDPNLQEKVNPNIKGLALANPIASDMSVMRTSLWTGLLQALQYNQKQQQARIRLFETGLRFVPNGDELQQEPMLSGLIAGQRYSEQWADKTEKWISLTLRVILKRYCKVPILIINLLPPHILPYIQDKRLKLRKVIQRLVLLARYILI